jgi:hypothetical protein
MLSDGSDNADQPFDELSTEETHLQFLVQVVLEL